MAIECGEVPREHALGNDVAPTEFPIAALPGVAKNEEIGYACDFPTDVNCRHRRTWRLKGENQRVSLHFGFDFDLLPGPALARARKRNAPGRNGLMKAGIRGDEIGNAEQFEKRCRFRRWSLRQFFYRECRGRDRQACDGGGSRAKERPACRHLLAVGPAARTAADASNCWKLASKREARSAACRS